MEIIVGLTDQKVEEILSESFSSRNSHMGAKGPPDLAGQHEECLYLVETVPELYAQFERAVVSMLRKTISQAKQGGKFTNLDLVFNLLILQETLAFPGADIAEMINLIDQNRSWFGDSPDGHLTEGAFQKALIATQVARKEVDIDRWKNVAEDGPLEEAEFALAGIRLSGAETVCSLWSFIEVLAQKRPELSIVDWWAYDLVGAYLNEDWKEFGKKYGLEGSPLFQLVLSEQEEYLSSMD